MTLLNHSIRPQHLLWEPSLSVMVFVWELR